MNPYISLQMLRFYVLMGLLSLAAACDTSLNETNPESDGLEVIRDRFQARLDLLLEEYGHPNPTIEYDDKEGGFRGATAAFVLHDGRSVGVATGYADFEESIPMTRGAKLLTASIGKTFVAATLVQMACAEHRLSLDDKISKWFGSEPWFNRLPNSADISVRMLLNHSAGIADYIGTQAHVSDIRQAFDNGEDFYPSHTKKLSYIFGMDPLFPAGTSSRYSSTHYILAGMIIEHLSESTLYNEIQTRFLDPFGLHDTLPADRKDIPGLVPGYMGAINRMGFPTKSGSIGQLSWDPTFEWAGGGFAGTTLDLVQWAKALYEGDVLGGACTAEMLTSVAPLPSDASATARRFALGVHIWPQTNLGTALGHGGLIPGYASRLLYFPRYGIAVAVSVNSGWGQPSWKFANELAKSLVEMDGVRN